MLYLDLSLPLGCVKLWVVEHVLNFQINDRVYDFNEARYIIKLKHPCTL